MTAMLRRSCVREAEVTRAIRTGAWPAADELQAHARLCRGCAEVALVAGALGAAAEGARLLPAPAPGILWWKAQLQRQNAALRTAARPLAWAIRISAAVVAAAAGLALYRVPVPLRMMPLLLAGLALLAAAGASVLLLAEVAPLAPWAKPARKAAEFQRAARPRQATQARSPRRSRAGALADHCGGKE